MFEKFISVLYIGVEEFGEERVVVSYYGKVFIVFMRLF